MKQSLNRAVVVSFLTFFLWMPLFAPAVSFTETRKPDGTIIKEERRTKLTPQAFYIVIGMAVVFGGVIAYQGIQVVVKGMELGNKQESAEVSVDLSQRTLKANRIAQGSLIVLVGAGVIVWALYFLTG